MELNPEHLTTLAMHDLWHKIVAMLMIRMGTKHVVIGQTDIDNLLNNEDSCVICEEKPNGIHLRMMSMEDAKEYVASRGIKIT